MYFIRSKYWNVFVEYEKSETSFKETEQVFEKRFNVRDTIHIYIKRIRVIYPQEDAIKQICIA